MGINSVSTNKDLLIFLLVYLGCKQTSHVTAVNKNKTFREVCLVPL